MINPTVIEPVRNGNRVAASAQYDRERIPAGKRVRGSQRAGGVAPLAVGTA